MAVVFKSLDKDNRTVTLEVDGRSVTRDIADNVSDTDAYIRSLAQGLAKEAASASTLSDTSFKADEVIVEDS